MNEITSYYAQEAIAVLDRKHWKAEVLGRWDVPTEPIYWDEKVLYPLQPGEMPEQGSDRLMELVRAGIPIKAVLVAHEAPRRLAAPKATLVQPETQTQYIKDTQSVSSSDAATALVEGLAMGLVFLAAGILMAILQDPAVIVILPDNTALEIIKWYEEVDLPS